MKHSFHITKNPELRKIITDKEIDANIAISKVLIVIAISNLLSWMFFYVGIWEETTSFNTNVFLLGNASLSVFSATICYLNKGKGKYLKYLLLISLSLVAFFINVFSGYKLWLLYALPIICACRYFDFRLCAIVYFLSDLLIVLSAFVDAYLYKLTGFIDLNTVYVGQGQQIDLSGYLGDNILALNPDSTALLMNELRITILSNIVVMSLVFVACIALLSCVRNIIFEMDAVNKQKAEMELEVANSRSRIMLSQIQPHFLYNTLSAIMAIDGNPDETIDAIGEFGKYLRENLDVITSGDMVSFQKELLHVQRYVSLEVLRFGDKINVDYDIQIEAFSIPAMTVQMLVENAIKHGISKKPGGGYVHVSTKEIGNEYVIVVEDNGIGFDPSKGTPQDGRSHVGLENIKSRLKNLCNGTIEIDSEVGKGTIAIVHVPKEGGVRQ